jgi:hypothetical protein
MSETNSSGPEIKPRGRPVEAVSGVFLNPIEVIEESDVESILYSKSEKSEVNIVPKETPVPQEVIDRLVAETDMQQYTADQINERKSENLKSEFSDDYKDEEIIEHFAKRILNCLKGAIDASEINGNNWVRLEVGTLRNKEITRQAINLAAAAMSSVDKRNIRVIPYHGIVGAELNGIDVVIPKS